MGRNVCVAVLVVSFMSLSALGQANWPQFRGARAGVVEDGVLPEAWSTSEHIA